MPGANFPKQQQMHRIAYTKLTPQQIAAELAPAATHSGWTLRSRGLDRDPRPVDSILAEMAAAQGGGMIRSSDRRVVEAGHVKAEAGWAMRLRLQEA